MPWKVSPVEDVRFAFVHQVMELRRPVAAACRDFGISRKTGYKWLGRAREAHASVVVAGLADAVSPRGGLRDRSRRPGSSPARTVVRVQEAILRAHDRFGWGARKLWAYLRDQGLEVPTPRTVHRVLRRAGRVHVEPPPAPRPQRFEHEAPNALWQLDFKGPIEVGRRPVHPLTILDDHSRFLLELRACDSPGAAAAWPVLWDVFGRVGLPEAILCDNAFGSYFHTPRTLSRFEANLLRLQVRWTHGRPFHPQTQGKVERLHGTLEYELWPRIDRTRLTSFQDGLDQWRPCYNGTRPHEAIGDRPPATRWKPSPRRRPPKLPEASYPPGSDLRIVSTNGTIRFRKSRILAGYGLTGEPVRLQETQTTIDLYFLDRRIRSINLDQLTPDRVL